MTDQGTAGRGAGLSLAGVSEATGMSSAESIAGLIPPGAGFTVRAVGEDDTGWVRKLLKQYWATSRIVSRGRVIDASELPGYAAFRDDEPIGLITYHVAPAADGDGSDCEIVTHNSLEGAGGVGSCLLAAVRQEARSAGCRRLWLVTTNDNTPALRFYQRREFDLVALHRNALQAARQLKPEVPDVGLGGIPLRHELELEYVL